jgi:acid phosphatase family membrane protein YuiD
MNPVLSFFLDLLHNYAFMSAGGAWLVAQASKVIYETVRYGFDTKRLAGGGGMPSTHSATVTGLTVGCLLQNSAASSEFAIALILAMVVMYDAMGVRKETGTEAKILNRLRKRDIRDGVKPLFNKPLEEKMGHTLPEVLVGIAIGIVMGIVMCRVSALIP